MFEVEEVGLMAAGIELCRCRPHDGDYRAVFQLRINSLNGVEAKHKVALVRGADRNIAAVQIEARHSGKGGPKPSRYYRTRCG